MEEMEENDFVPLDTEVTSATEAELAPGPSGPNNNNQPIRRKWVASLKWYIMELVVPVLYPEVLEGDEEDYLEARRIVAEEEELTEEAIVEEAMEAEEDENEIADSSDEDADAWAALEAGADNEAALEAMERIANKATREVYSFDLYLMT